MSTQETQARLLGGPSGESATIKTSGNVIRPALNVAEALVDECKLRFSNDGLYLRAVDPANVVLIELTVHPEAFESYAVDAEDELVVGNYIAGLSDKLSNARLGKSTDDPVEIDIDEGRTVIEIAREYSQTTVRYADEQLNIDPGHIRQEPELPELDLSAQATVDADAFNDAVQHVNTSGDSVVFREVDGSLWMTGDGNEESPSDYATAVEFEAAMDNADEMEDDPVAKYSLDYLTDMAKAVKTARAETVTVRWDDQMPTYLEFEREIDDAVAYDARYMLAPRIHKERDGDQSD